MFSCFSLASSSERTASNPRDTKYKDLPIIHINATFNNTLLTVTDSRGMETPEIPDHNPSPTQSISPSSNPTPTHPQIPLVTLTPYVSLPYPLHTHTHTHTPTLSEPKFAKCMSPLIKLTSLIFSVESFREHTGLGISGE